MGFDEVVDTSGSRPTIRVAALVSAVLGTAVYGWFLGVIETFRAVTDGGIVALDATGDWLVEVITEAFRPVLAQSIAFGNAADFFSVFGPFAFPASVAFVATFAWLMLAGASALLGGGS